MSAALKISVVVPTYDRVDLLRRNLAALLRQTLDPALYEVVVVHNDAGDGRGDGTARLLEVTAARQPRIRHVVESRQGVAYARNAGLHAARGEILVCTDDDAFAPPNWLETILASFDRVRPTPHVVGGPILPLVIGRRPAWFRDQYEVRSWGDRARFVGPGERPFPTGNVAYRRDLLLAAGGYDNDLGMRGHIMGFAEDDEVFARLRQAAGGDLRVYYTPEAFVHHAVPDEKMDPVYRFKRNFVYGQTRHQLRARTGRAPGFEEFARETYRLLRATVGAVAAAPRARHAGDWFIGSALPVARSAGYLAAALGIRVRVRR
jgi:glycosyltransferase involved in cell wall biosynthesis